MSVLRHYPFHLIGGITYLCRQIQLRLVCPIGKVEKQNTGLLKSEYFNSPKLCIRTGYGFRNIDNLIALIMLRCTSLPISLPHMAAA
jgi:hypothetical protein